MRISLDEGPGIDSTVGLLTASKKVYIRYIIRRKL